MYLLPNCTDARGYFPINTKWGGTSTLSGLLPGGGLRYFRPNFAMARGNYPGGGDSSGRQLGQMTKPESVAAEKWYLGRMSGRMGQLAVDPSLLAAGVGTLALGMFLLGRKHPKRRKRRR